MHTVHHVALVHVGHLLCVFACSRVGISLLSNLGMAEMVAFNRKEYEDLAGTNRLLRRQVWWAGEVQLTPCVVVCKPVLVATHPRIHTTLQRKLRDDALKHPLFQTPAYTQALEASQRVMYDLHAAGAPAHHIVTPAAVVR